MLVLDQTKPDQTTPDQTISDQTTAAQTTVARFSIAIAGGGMTGAMLALALLEQNPQLQLAIIEQQSMAEATQPVVTPTASFDSRSIALAAASVELLHRLGLWAEVRQYACAIAQIKVSDRGHFGKVQLDANSLGRESMGSVIEIEWLGALLYAKLQTHVARGALTWFRPAQIATLQQQQDLNLIQLVDGRSLCCDLLVLAEGGDSPTRQLAGFQSLQQPYQQTALIANIGVATPHQQIAYERFTANGPIALLPLTRQRYSLVWTLSPSEALAMQRCDDAEFLAALQQAFGYSAGVFMSVGQRHSYPLVLKYSPEVARHRVLLCGNSLHNLHPIAGQGFNLAMRDIAAICQLVQHELQLSATADVGAYRVWRRYQQVRQHDMQQVITMTDGMVRLFSNQSRLMALGRNMGLTALMQCRELKHGFAEQSMGLTPLHIQQQRIQQWYQWDTAQLHEGR